MPSKDVSEYALENLSHNNSKIITRNLIDRSHHSAAEHRASTRILHLTVSLASVVISAQVFLTPLPSSSTVLRHVLLGLSCSVCLGDSTLGLA